MLEIRSASDTKLKVSEIITLNICMDESQTRVTFGVVNKLAVPVLLVTKLIDRAIKSIHTAERKIVPHHSSPISVSMVRDAQSEAEKNSESNK